MFVLRNALMRSDKLTSNISHIDQLSSVLRCALFDFLGAAKSHR